jgi:hypothetical protein
VQDGRNLPAAPLTRSALPPGVTPLAGRLASYTGPRGRPFVGLIVACPTCKGTHRYPWRWDWGLSADVVGCQASHCRKGKKRPVWLALDPVLAAENAAAHEVYEAWKAAKGSAPPQPPGDPGDPSP